MRRSELLPAVPATACAAAAPSLRSSPVLPHGVTRPHDSSSVLASRVVSAAIECINDEEQAVEVIAVGVREHNRLRIGGEEVDL